MRDKAAFTHGTLFEEHSVRVEAFSTHRIPVGPSSVRDKATFAHGILFEGHSVRDQPFSTHRIPVGSLLRAQ